MYILMRNMFLHISIFLGLAFSIFHKISLCQKMFIIFFQYGHDCSSCRKVSRFNVGQNIFITYGYL